MGSCRLPELGSRTMLVLVMFLATAVLGEDSFNHFPRTAGRSDDIVPRKTGVAPTGRPGLDKVDTGRTEALIAFVGEGDLDDRRRRKRKIVNVGYKPWERTRNNAKQKQTTQVGSRRKHLQRVLIPKKTEIVNKTVEGVKAKRNLRRIRNKHKDSPTADIKSEDIERKTNASVSVSKKEKEKQEEKGGSEMIVLETSVDNPVFLPTQSTPTQQKRQRNRIKSGDRIKNTKEEEENTTQESADKVVSTTEIIEDSQEDYPIMSETALASPVNYLALAKLAQVTSLQDPFRMRRY